MSEAKTPNKAETISKKNEAAKTEVTKTETAKTETTNTESKSVDNSATKSVSSPKSAAQSSISHFSSVSTPQYRSGWNNIFGDGNDVKKAVPDEAIKNGFPEKLEILDDNIDVILRNILDEAFNDLAKMHGISLKSLKKSVRFEYSINCEIREK